LLEEYLFMGGRFWQGVSLFTRFLESGGWFTLVTTSVYVTAIATLIGYGLEHGWRAPLALIVTQYNQLMEILFGWLATPLSKFGQLPFWWKEGLVLLALILGQWFQVIRDRRVNLSEAFEFFATTLITGIGAYLIDVAQDPLQAFFIGVAGVFIQLLVRGSLSFARGAPDAEAWAGRYLLRSAVVGGLAVLVFFAIQAGQGLMEARSGP
jgi:hypothetical protein